MLEQAGLSPFADFQSEVSVDTDDGRLRPDVIVRLPGGRKLIIDAKCSLNAYLDASEEVDEAARTAHLRSTPRRSAPMPSSSARKTIGSSSATRRLCHPLHSRRAFPDRGARAGRPPLGMVVRAPCAARHADQPRRDRPHRRQRLAAGAVAEQAAEIAALGKELHARLATMGRQSARMAAISSWPKCLQRLRRQPRKPGADPGEALRGRGSVGGPKEIEALPVIRSRRARLQNCFPTEGWGKPN